MKTCALLKHIGLAAIALSVAVGCTTTPIEQEIEKMEAVKAVGAEQTKSLSDAEDAIAWAKAVRFRANGLGCEWNDTGVLISDAQAQSDSGSYDNAVAMANRAEERGAESLEECEKASMEESPSAMAMTTSYTVSSGDSLWGISSMDSIYGDPYQWPLIYRANSGKIEDADLIFPGQVFNIDQAVSGAQLKAAISHARNRGAWSVGVVEDSDREYLSQ
jgi:nucleoid-associated protein YgaU